jgi:plasmid stability protein
MKRSIRGQDRETYKIAKALRGRRPVILSGVRLSRTTTTGTRAAQDFPERSSKMSSNLSIRNIPDDVMRGLQSRAAQNQRTLQQEVLAILREAARDQVPLSMDVLIENATKRKADLDQAASRIRAEQAKAAERFEDLLGRDEKDL